MCLLRRTNQEYKMYEKTVAKIKKDEWLSVDIIEECNQEG